MKVLSDAEVHEQFVGFTKGNQNFAQLDGKDLYFIHPEVNCIDLEYPAKLERLPFFARFLATIGRDAEHFDGALLWITQWGVWNYQDEGIGYHVIEAMHRAAGQPVSFEVGRGHNFRADELDDAIAMLLQPMVFGWDAFFLPTWSWGGAHPFFLHVSHDSFVTIVTRTKEFHDQVLTALQKVDLNPNPGHELQVRRFCRAS